MMTSLLNKLSISIKIEVVKPLCLVSSLSTESVGSRRELVANSVHTADADETQLDSFVASASVVCIGLRYSGKFRKFRALQFPKVRRFHEIKLGGKMKPSFDDLEFGWSSYTAYRLCKLVNLQTILAYWFHLILVLTLQMNLLI